jgi:hypothetical protein
VTAFWNVALCTRDASEVRTAAIMRVTNMARAKIHLECRISLDHRIQLQDNSNVSTTSIIHGPNDQGGHRDRAASEQHERDGLPLSELVMETPQPLKGRRMKRQSTSTRLHDTTSQKVVIFIFIGTRTQDRFIFVSVAVASVISFSK